MSDRAAQLLGVFGGTFDPIHLGHLRTALDVAEVLDAPIHMIPAASPVHRGEPGASAQQRLKMLTLAVADNARLVVDDREIIRGGSSYMIDTLESLAASFPNSHLCLIVGEDAFAGLDRWHRWQELFNQAHVVVMTRPGNHRQGSAALTEFCAARVGDDPDVLRNTPQGRVLRVPVTPLSISASDIRQRLRNGRSPAYLLPAVVADYIVQKKLYVGGL